MSVRRFLSGLFLLGLGLGVGIRIGLDWRPAPVPPLRPASPAVPAAPIREPPPELACEVTACFQGNIYPSLLLSLGAAIPDYARCLTITLRHARPGHAYRIGIDSTLFQQPLAFAADANASTWVVNPDLPWDYAALRRNAQSVPELFAVSVTPEGGPTLERDLTVMVHPVNEAVSRIYDPDTRQWDDTSVCYAAFVNEDHPWINTLLAEAMARSGLPRFTGYESGPAEVVPQLRAVWEAMAARGLRYVDLATTRGGAAEVATQYVRFLDQSIRDRGANCVDAAVLFASIFRRIGLRPVLIFRPGHCFVAVYDSAAGGRLLALETTLLGAEPFRAALALGGEELAAVTPNLGLPGYSSVDIATARGEGVRPIGFAAGEP